MKPLNQPAQKAAIQKFVIAYVVSILLILIAAYFWFSSPSRMVTDELKKSQSFIAEHDSLIFKTTSITSMINALKDFESKNATTSPAADNTIKDYLVDIHNAVHNLSLDSSTITYPALATSLRNYLVAYDALVNYGQDVRSLKGKNSTLQTMLDSKPENGQNPFKDLLITCNNDKDNLMRQLAELKSAKTAGPPAGGGGGGGAPANYAEVTKLREDNAKLQQERDQAKAAKAQADEEIKQKDAQISRNAGNSSPATGGGCSEADKATAMYKAADILYNKGIAGKINDVKRGYLSGSLDILKNAATQSYQDKGQLQARIRDINNILNPIGNN